MDACEDNQPQGERPDRIGAIAEVVEVRSDRHGTVRLPNGKLVTGFIGERALRGVVVLQPGLRVTVEMHPFDMSRARIVGAADEGSGMRDEG